MLKVIKGNTIPEQIQSIDSLISSLFERRYSLAVDLIPSQIPQVIPISVRVPAGKIGGKAFPVAGIITKLTCVSLLLKKETLISVTIISNNQSTTTKFSLPSNKVQDTDLLVPAGSEIDIELVEAIDGDVYVGLVFTPNEVREAKVVK
jgi:hypothetical protein